MKQLHDVDIPESLKTMHIHDGLIFTAVHAVRTNKRNVTAQAKTRGEVRGTTAKPYRQKGTGRARHGDLKSNIFIGGGAAFGPRCRMVKDRLPAAQKRKALEYAVAMKVQEDKLVVLDAWVCSEMKTKPMAAALQQLGIVNGLLVIDAPNQALSRSVRNIPRIGVREARVVSAYDLLQYDALVLSKAAFEQLKERIAA